MAAVVQCGGRRRWRLLSCVCCRALSSTPVEPLTRLLLKLNQHFYDVENLVDWRSWLRRRSVQRKNVFYGYTQRNYGENVAAAYYILSLRGSFRFAGQADWFRPNSRGRFSFDFMNSPDAVIEEADLSNTLINHAGLDNLVSQRSLRSLSLRGCPEVDGWSLARLHVFQDLEQLDVSHCPRITAGGLAALHTLRNLRRLDVSSLPQLQNPGLVRILLEEMHPQCDITGAEYSQGLHTHSITPYTPNTPHTHAEGPRT